MAKKGKADMSMENVFVIVIAIILILGLLLLSQGPTRPRTEISQTVAGASPYNQITGSFCSYNDECSDGDGCTADICDSGKCKNPNVDLSGNKIVGMDDVQLINLYLGIREGEKDWDPKLDVDGDKNIGLSDIMLVQNCWGNKC
ncbi:MAG: hypothetical protein JXB14_01715 [Candidatus Altiarchaeota archaeon]|nr:hypothetical protein [Candidatus Altiarchaeota archaeon]